VDHLGGHIALISGSPGSGKTTTAELLARQPGQTPKVHLHTDDFWGYIKHGHIDPWLDEAAAQNAMIMEIAAGVAERYAQAGYFVALDGVIGPWSLDAYLRLQSPLHYILLRPTVAEAVARCEARGGDSLTDAQVVAAIHAMFGAITPYEAHVMNTSGLNKDQTLAAVIAALESGAYRLPRG
jgi:predicted kinase